MTPYVFIALSNILGGSTYAATASALKGFPLKDMILLRMALCAALFLPLAWRGRRRLATTSLRDWAFMISVGLFGYSLPLALGTYGVKLSSSTNASLLIGIEPVAIVLLSTLFLGETLTRLKIISIVLGLTGAMLITFSSPSMLPEAFVDRFKGDMILVAHGCFWALYTVLGKPALKHVAPLDFTAVTSIIGFFGVAVWAGPGAHPAAWAAAPHSAWLALSYLSIAGSFLGVIFWNEALKTLKASSAANFIFLQPVVGVLLGVGLQGDQLTRWSAAGGALVLSGMWLGNR